MKINEGDYVVYKPTNEFGKVKHAFPDYCFVWYHSGDTAARTSIEFLRLATEDEIENCHEFDNMEWIYKENLGAGR